jgi:Ethanolamine utilization protein EutJ (predicted chaperonin)
VVSCAKRNVNRQPNEETQLALDVGIDLHAHNRVVVVLDEQERVVYQKR